MTNIILCGGSGTRLWPVSRERYPKQFCNLTGKHSLFQDTLLRNRKLCNKTIIVTNEQHYSLAAEQIDALSIQNVAFILEPTGRNTAPAITIACLLVNDDDIVLVTPSDHCIQDREKYREAMQKAKEFAKDGYLVTFGVMPSCPETGYGYIEVDGENVVSFKEKPNEKTARQYIKAGRYYWNSGMFMFKAKTCLDETKMYSSDIYTASQNAVKNRKIDNNIVKIVKSYMEKIPSNSIDYAVMEKSKIIKVVSLDANWSDLGSFEALYKISKADGYGNVSSSKDIFLGSGNNFVMSGDRTITLIDVDDLIVVNTGDAILISKKGSSHKIKEVIPELKKIAPDIV